MTEMFPLQLPSLQGDATEKLRFFPSLFSKWIYKWPVPFPHLMVFGPEIAKEYTFITLIGTKAFFTCCQLISLQVLSILRTAGFFASHAQLHRTSCSHDAHMMATLRSAWWSCSTSFPCRHLQSITIYPSFSTCGYSQWRNCVKNQEWKDWLHQFQSSHVDPTTRMQKMAGWIMNWWDVKCNRSGAHTALQSGFPIKQNKRNNHNKAGIPSNLPFQSPNSQPVNQIAWNFFSVRRAVPAGEAMQYDQYANEPDGFIAPMCRAEVELRQLRLGFDNVRRNESFKHWLALQMSWDVENMDHVDLA